MRKPALLLTVILFTFFSPAQESFTIKMTLRMEGLPREYAPYAEQEITTQIKGEMSKTEVSSMMLTSQVFFRNDTLTTLNDVMGNRHGYIASGKELTEEKTSGDAPESHIQYTGEKKEIAGYECEKAIVTSVKRKNEKVSDSMKVILWVTPEIRTNQTPRQVQQQRGGIDLGDLKGHPLEMEMTHQQDGNDVRVLMTTLSVDTAALPDSIFIPDTKGFKMMSYEEWKVIGR